MVSARPNPSISTLPTPWLYSLRYSTCCYGIVRPRSFWLEAIISLFGATCVKWAFYLCWEIKVPIWLFIASLLMLADVSLPVLPAVVSVLLAIEPGSEPDST